MKSSMYNIYRKDKNGYVLFNTFTRAVAQIDEEIKILLDENPSKIPDDILGELLKNGFVVEGNYDETKKLAYYFDRDKYDVIPDDLGYTVAMTYACNLRCPYCYQGIEKDTEILNNKRVNTLLKNIDKNLSKRNFNMLRLGLYGGEPLLAYDQCVQLMKGAFCICDQQDRKFEGGVITNGVLINEGIVDNLLRPYCNKVQLTMDGGREAHDKRRIRRDGSGTYDTILDVMELLRDADIEVNLRLNVDKDNANTFIDLFRDLIDRGLEDIKKACGWVHPPDDERIGEGCPSYTEKCLSHKEMVDIEDQIYRQMDEMGIPHGLVAISRHMPCTFDREDIYLVDPYLDLYNCWEFLGQRNKKVGHIDESGETIFNYEYYEQISRNPLKFEDCMNCKFLPLCGGGCAARAYLEKGTIHSSSCGRFKYSMEKHMDEYIDNIVLL